MFFKKKMTVRERMAFDIERSLKRMSRGKMPRSIRHELAKRTVSRLNLDNPYQMQCSMESYAADLLFDYNKQQRFPSKH